MPPAQCDFKLQETTNAPLPPPGAHLLFLSPAVAADEVPLEGGAWFLGDEDCAGGVKSGTCILAFQLRGKAAKLLFDGLRDEAQKKNAPAAWRNPAAMAFFATPMRMEPTSVNSAIPLKRMLSPSVPGTVEAAARLRKSSAIGSAEMRYCFLPDEETPVGFGCRAENCDVAPAGFAFVCFGFFFSRLLLC